MFSPISVPVPPWQLLFSPPHGSYTSVPLMAVALLTKFLFRTFTNARTIAINIASVIAFAVAIAIATAVSISNTIYQ